MEVKTTPSKSNSPASKVSSPIASANRDSAEKQRRRREEVAARRNASEEAYRAEAAVRTNDKMQKAAERKRQAEHAIMNRAVRENVKIEQAKSRVAWTAKRKANAAAAKVQSAIENARQVRAQTADKARMFNERVQKVQKRKAEQEKDFQQRAKERYEVKMKIKGPANAAVSTPPPSTPIAPETLDEESEEAAALAALKLKSPQERMEEAEQRRTSRQRQIQQRAARHNIRSKQVQAKTAWERKQKTDNLRVKIAKKEENVSKLVSTPVYAAKHNKHVAEVQANVAASAEKRRQELQMQMQERQALAGERRMKALSPPKRKASSEQESFASRSVPSSTVDERVTEATRRREALLAEKKTKAARHNLRAQTVATNKMWHDARETRERRDNLNERIANASTQRANNLRLRQEKVRVDNRHKQFVAETAQRMYEADQINAAVAQQVGQLKAGARRTKFQEEKVAFASEQSKSAAEKAYLTKQLEHSKQNYSKLKIENDLAQAELKRMSLLNQRSLIANRNNAYKRDVARLHYDYAETAKAEQREALERKQREAEERRRAQQQRQSPQDDVDVEVVGRSITDFGRQLFNIAMDL